MTVTLRPYQSDMVSRVYQSWNEGARNVLSVMPTGAGKSVVVSQIVSDRNNMGARQVVMAHRTELVAQMSMHVANRGVPHSIIAPASVVSEISREHRKTFNGRSFVNPDARCTVAAAQTLVARADSLKQWGEQIDDWTVDECFPAGTMILTRNGSVPIENIAEGVEVLSFSDCTDSFDYRPVTHLFRNPAPEKLVRLTWGGHHVIEATYGHPFWTPRGWVEAINLTRNDWILTDVSMHILPERNKCNYGISTIQFSQKGNHFLPADSMWNEISRNAFGKEKSTKDNTACSGLFNLRKSSSFDETSSEEITSGNWSGLLQQGLFASLRFANVLRSNGENKSQICLGTNVEKQPNEKIGNSGESFSNSQVDWSSTFCSRRQRKTYSRSGKSVENNFGTLFFCASVYFADRIGSQIRFSNSLQIGHGASRFENLCGGGRNFSQFFRSAEVGRTQRRSFGFKRLESIEIFKSSNFDRASDGFVYNFEVDDFNTYIANGVVVHNCHHLLASNTWGKAVNLFPNARGLGVTATPSRADGMGLGRHADGLMDVMLLGPQMRELIEGGSLTEYEIALPESDFSIDDDALTPSGDYSPKKMREASRKSHLVGDVVQEYSKRAFGKRAICFATDVETSGEIANMFNAAGIPAASVSAKTPSHVRAEMIRRFRVGQIWVLVNVDLFGEGFDCPSCDVVIMARPTASLGLYMQAFGRALRPDPANPLKVALIIDHVSNVLRHGLPDKPRQWTLDRREKRAKREPDPEEIPLTVCRGCSRPYERFHTCCPYCGWEPPLAAPGSRTIEQVDGDLVLLDRDRLAAMRAAVVLESPASVCQRVSAAAGPLAGKGQMNHAIERHAAQKRLSDAIAQWAAIQRAKGRDDRQSYKRFYIATGIDVLSALTGSRQDMDRLAETVEGWWKI